MKERKIKVIKNGELQTRPVVLRRLLIDEKRRLLQRIQDINRTLERVNG